MTKEIHCEIYPLRISQRVTQLGSKLIFRKMHGVGGGEKLLLSDKYLF